MLECGPSIAEAKAGVVECERLKGGGDGGLRDVFRVYGHLVVSLQDVHLGENLRPVEVGGDIGDVGKGVTIGDRYHVESSVVTTRAKGAIFFRHDEQQDAH